MHGTALFSLVRNIGSSIGISIVEITEKPKYPVYHATAASTSPTM